MNDFIELRRVFTIILRRWWWLVILTVLTAIMGNIVSHQQAPVYQATATILVGDSIKSSHVDRVDIQVSEALVATYVQLARRQPVLQGVITALNLKQTWQKLYTQVEVTQIEGTQLIEIKVEANSPDMARTIADEIVNQLILFSPTNSESRENDTTNNFNREQIKSLQERISNAQNRLVEIETAMSTSISEIQLADLQKEKIILEELLVGWERNYTELLALTDAKRNPTQLSVIESAHSNDNQIRPRIQLNTLLSGGLGIVLGLGLIFLLEFLDDTYKSLNDFSQSEEVNILGSIRRIKGKSLSDKIVARLHPHSPITESYRILRSRIRFKPVDKPTRSIMVTSSMPGEGKSLTVANLAVVFAQANYKTIIVDADLRHPVLHKIFDVSNEVGLGDMLGSPEIKIGECLRDTPVNNLRILTSGNPLLDPSERLGSDRMAEILIELKNDAEIVIFDSPPVLVFADAIVLSRRIDGVIVVIQAGKSKRGAIAQTLFDLQNANANLLGSIFNQSPKSDTFSVNKAYMQERPQLPSPEALVKKERADKGQFHDLRDSAMPLKENLELHELGREEASIDTTQFHGLDDWAKHKHKDEDLDLRSSKSDVEVKEKVIDSKENMKAASEKIHMLGSQENKNNGSKSEENAVDQINIPIDEDLDLRSLKSDVEVKEKVIDFQENTNGVKKKRQRNRSRKNKSNGHMSEEVAPDQINVPVDDGANVSRNSISVPVDQTIVLADRINE